jgi:hypothetical protein
LNITQLQLELKEDLKAQIDALLFFRSLKTSKKYVLGYQLVFNDGYVYLSIVCDCHEKDITLIGNNFFS